MDNSTKMLCFFAEKKEERKKTLDLTFFHMEFQIVGFQKTVLIFIHFLCMKAEKGLNANSFKLNEFTYKT